MPKISCPKCGASVFAVAMGHTVEVKGGADLESCVYRSEDAADELALDDVLECPQLEKAIEAAIDRLVGLPGAVVWPTDGEGARMFERWRPFNGVVDHSRGGCQAVVLDISPSGAAVWAENSRHVRAASKVTFRLSGYGELPSEVVRLEGGVLGLMFLLDGPERRKLGDWLSHRREALEKAQPQS